MGLKFRWRKLLLYLVVLFAHNYISPQSPIMVFRFILDIHSISLLIHFSISWKSLSFETISWLLMRILGQRSGSRFTKSHSSLFETLSRYSFARSHISAKNIAVRLLPSLNIWEHIKALIKYAAWLLICFSYGIFSKMNLHFFWYISAYKGAQYLLYRVDSRSAPRSPYSTLEAGLSFSGFFLLNLFGVLGTFVSPKLFFSFFAVPLHFFVIWPYFVIIFLE